MHRKLSGQIQGREHSRERKGTLIRQEDVIVIRFESLQLLGSWIFYWRKICHKYTKFNKLSSDFFPL